MRVAAVIRILHCPCTSTFKKYKEKAVRFITRDPVAVWRDPAAFCTIRPRRARVHNL